MQLNQPTIDYAWGIIEAKAKDILKSLASRIIRKVQKYGRETMILGDDSGLTNLWDDYCAQKQYEEGWGFDMQEDLIDGVCLDSIEELEARNNTDYKILALYLTVDHIDFDLGHPLDDNSLVLYGNSELSDFLFDEIKSIAMNYENSRIKRYLEYR